MQFGKRLLCSNFVAVLMQMGQTGAGTASLDVNHPNKQDERPRAAEQAEIQDDAGRHGDDSFRLSFGLKPRIRILMQNSFM